ncbi:MAG: PAS domain S-box protein [Deltaproteobacteria bacterium]|nr:PAS domain S-box protein [Deltaproteobacteria bacterium]MBW2633486.1 PAS domain S-box protein [Deltaproteobacteria bacterium]
MNTEPPKPHASCKSNFHCREILACNRKGCPAYDSNRLSCWHISGTLCDNHGAIHGPDKFRDCLICPVFQCHAESDVRGWNYFVSDELSGFIKQDLNTLTLKKLEDHIRFSEGNYRRLFEGSKDMIFITDRNGVFEDVNQACVDLLGYTDKRELLDLSSVESIYAKVTHWTVFKKQIDQHGFVKDFEAQFKRKDRNRIHCLISGHAVRGIHGEIVGYQGIAKDITARMDAIRNFRQRHRELWVLNTVAFAMNRSLNLNSILLTALEKVLEVLDLSAGGIFLIDTNRSEFVLSAKKGFPENSNENTVKIKLQDEVLMQSLVRKDLELEPEPIFPPFRADLMSGSRHLLSGLTCFLITARNKACGFLALDVPSDRNITEGHDYHLLGSLGNFLGGSIENAQLLDTIQQHREQLKRLTARLFHSQETERRRIARELHDEAGQALTGINFTLESAEKYLRDAPGPLKDLILDVKKQINQTYHEMRRLSHRLHPALLTDMGLEPALDAYLTGVAEYSPIQIDFKMIGFIDRVSPDIESVLYRLSQEALTNTLKHAQADTFSLSIIKGYPHIIFVARDNGKGFDPDAFDENKQALGLLSMRERAAMLGGTFHLSSTKGKGTKIRIEIPVKESSDE